MNKPRQRFSPRVFLYGQATPDQVVLAMNNFIGWEAFIFADEVSDQVDSHLAQDLEQEAWLFVFRQLQRDPDIWARKLERLTYLSIKSALRRGRSVFRADPGTRDRQYERVPLEQATVADLCIHALPFDQEHQLLVKALRWSQHSGDREAEHQSLLLLRRLVRRYEMNDLIARYNLALRDWWRQTRAQEGLK